MYPAALHKNPTQTVDSSQIFEKWILQNQPTTKGDQQNDKKLGQKQNQRSGTGLSQAGPIFPLLIVVVKDKFT